VVLGKRDHLSVELVIGVPPKPVAEAAGLAAAQGEPVERNDFSKRALILVWALMVLGKRDHLSVELEESVIHVPLKPGFGEPHGFAMTVGNLPKDEEDLMVPEVLEKEHDFAKRADPQYLEACWEVWAVARCY
jgi:hypothetical protein